MEDLEFKINVTSFLKVEKNPVGFYDGYVELGGCKLALRDFSKKTVSPGVFTDLNDIADAIKNVVKEETKAVKGNIAMDELQLNYDSKPDLFYGGRGYTNSEGSYLQKPLDENDMGYLIQAVDFRIRPIFYDPWKDSQ